jgi:hypothetical protein
MLTLPNYFRLVQKFQFFSLGDYITSFRLEKNRGENMKTGKKSHAFSVELNHKRHLKVVAIPSNGSGSVVVEGFLGELVNLGFVEGSLLEIHGVNGSFRIDLKCEEARKIYNAAVKEVKQ